VPKLLYAGVGVRFAALLIDFLLLSVLFFPATRAIKGTWLMSAADHVWSVGWFVSDPLCLTFLAIIVAYFVLSEGLWGATPGKRLLRLEVISADGSKVSITQGLVRNILRAVDSLPAFNVLGVILILRSPERARFGDRVAGTRVVRESQPIATESE